MSRVFCWQHNDQSVTAANPIRPELLTMPQGIAQSSKHYVYIWKLLIIYLLERDVDLFMQMFPFNND